MLARVFHHLDGCRICGVMRKCWIQARMELDYFASCLSQQARTDNSGCSIASVQQYPRASLNVNSFHDVRHINVIDWSMRYTALAFDEILSLDKFVYLFDLFGIRCQGIANSHLHSIPSCRVVACCYRRTAGRLEMELCPVQHRCGHHSNIEHFTPRGNEAGNQGPMKLS